MEAYRRNTLEYSDKIPHKFQVECYLNIFRVFLCKIPLHFGFKFSFFHFNSGWISSKIVFKCTKIGLNFSRILYYVRVVLWKNYTWIQLEIQSTVLKKGISTLYVLEAERGNILEKSDKIKSFISVWMFLEYFKGFLMKNSTTFRLEFKLKKLNFNPKYNIILQKKTIKIFI